LLKEKFVWGGEEGGRREEGEEEGEDRM